MSYRVTVEGKQLFGNNESYQTWDDFIRSQGIEIDEEGCYDGEITDFMGAVAACEAIVMEVEACRQDARKTLLASYDRLDPERQKKLMELTNAQVRSIFDLTDIPMELEKEKAVKYPESLFDKLYSAVSHGYMFIPFALYLICRDKLEQIEEPELPDGPAPGGYYRIRTFRLKRDETIHVHAG